MSEPGDRRQATRTVERRNPKQAVSDCEIRTLESEWAELTAKYLPILSQGSPWRFSRANRPDELEQGWKLHLSADILSAIAMLGAVAPYLTARDIHFKAPASLLELKRINCGMFYGFSQIGKFITVYPNSPGEAVEVGHALHLLTRRLAGPTVPYDCSLFRKSLLHYRYGSFTLESETNGVRQSAIRTPTGELVADQRGPGLAVPEWAIDPFTKGKRASPSERHRVTPLKFIRAFEALSQRGKGGVYRALDLRASPARLCVLKEGRRHGETDWDGRDGYWRVRHEVHVLRRLARAGIPVPSVLATFRAEEHYYVALENIEGESLQTAIARIARTPWSARLAQALHDAAAITAVVCAIHAAGWVWRDCKPLNFIVTSKGTVRPVDFEGACRVDALDLMPWGTAGYVPPEWLVEPQDGSRIAEDLYALGATLFHLFTAKRPDDSVLQRIRRLRRWIPPKVKDAMIALLGPNPSSRPTAATVLGILQSASAENPPHGRLDAVPPTSPRRLSFDQNPSYRARPQSKRQVLHA